MATAYVGSAMAATQSAVMTGAGTFCLSRKGSDGDYFICGCVETDSSTCP